MIYLESVGTVLDSNGMTYPMLEGGGYDADAGIHLRDIEEDGDWMNNLSDTDWSVVDLAIKIQLDGRISRPKTSRQSNI